MPSSPMERGRCLEIELPAASTTPSHARRIARQACTDWDIPDAADDVALVVSELVTNAVVHAKTPVILAIQNEGATLAIAVGDGLPTMPWLADPAPEHTGGRGVLLVSRLGSNWGVIRTVLGKTVWASMTVEPTSSDQTAPERMTDRRAGRIALSAGVEES